jgi:hypothetical protein
MDEQSIEPARAQSAPEDPIADVPRSEHPYQPWQPVTPQNPWQQGPWQPVDGQVAPMQAPATWQPQPTWPDPGPWHPPLKADAGLPPGWHAPLRTDLIPAPQPRRRRSMRVILIAAAVVVLLVAGVTTWLVWPPDRSPFEQAVANLAGQPVVNYKAQLPDGTQWDGRSTEHGDAVGWLTGRGQRFPFMLLNSKLYVRLDAGLFPPGADTQLPDGVKLKDRWVTGDLGLLGPLINQSIKPSVIADQLRGELAATPKLPAPSDDGTTIDNVPVLQADTPHGTLYVAKYQPYQVVRWIDKNTTKSQAAFANPGRKLQLNGGQGGYSGLGTVDFTAMSADNVDQTYDDMETDVGQLGDALDSSVRMTFDGIDHLDGLKACATGPGCTVTAHFLDAPRGLHGTLPNEVTAQMTAQVTLNDTDAGTCTTTGKVASNGPGTLGCTVTNMAAAFQQANDKAKADAEAKAGYSGYISWYVQANVKVFALPVASVDLAAEGKRLESLRPDHACGWTDKGGSKRDPIQLTQMGFTARYDTARYPDFEIHVFRDGEAYGDFGPGGWFAKNGGSVPTDVPAGLNGDLKTVATTFMKANGTLKDGDDTSGDKWKRPAPHC